MPTNNSIVNMQERPCIFCNREGFEKQIILENDMIRVIHARSPLNPGHLMILTTAHRTSLLEISELECAAIFKMITSMTKALNQVYACNDYNIFTNVGVLAGQSIPHCHVHIVPRFNNEKISPFEILNSKELQKNLQQATEQELSQAIEAIRGAYEKLSS